MELLEVSNNKSLVKEFLELPVRLYEGEKHWIRPLNKDVEAVFDATKNPFFKHGSCIRWVLQLDGKVVGRIAAFINENTAAQENSREQKLRVGGLGFFESIDDKDVASALFDQAIQWLKARDCNAVDGPINFGERMSFWGLLVEGFDIDPNLNMPYTKQYYQTFFEDYGFQVYFKQITYGRKVAAPLHPVYEKVSKRLFDDPKYTFTTIDTKKIKQFTEDFCNIYNEAWGGHEGVKPMTMEEATAQMRELKQILDPKVVYFAYYEGRPVAFYINIPEINQIIKHIKNGKLDLIGLVKFVWHLKIAKTNKKMMGLVFGVVPEFQRKGVMIGLVEYCRQIVQGPLKSRYIDYEMNWIGDFNPRMMKISEGIGAPIKWHHTYRKILVEGIVFERHKEL